MAGDQWRDEPGDLGGAGPRRPRDPWDDASSLPPPRTGMSGGMKAVLIIVGILGTCSLLCCGVLFYIGYSFSKGIKQSENPAEVDQARNEMCTISLPKGFKPQRMFGMDNFLMSMTAVEYRNPDVHGNVTLASMQLKMGNKKQSEVQVRQQLETQGFSRTNVLDDSKSETKTIKIKGRDCKFEFTQGINPDDHKHYREVSGVFDGTTGQVSISIEMDESAYKQ